MGKAEDRGVGLRNRTEPLRRATFTVQLQANEKKADFAKRFTELKAELSTIQSAEPQLNKWDTPRWTSKGEMTFPAYSSSSTGWVFYVWLIREFEMEGVRTGKKTMFKAQVRTKEESASISFGGDCRFDFESGEVVHANHGKRR